ncbi:signal peptidase II [Methylocystis iwaonis]|uniref:signal peptidase II n=1 Tax=Methylocystis iwaonis TaxID=2885079 RepID=UPI002490DEA7|nr:signal peptidase II [Methylocystis iwaonis]
MKKPSRRAAFPQSAESPHRVAVPPFLTPPRILGLLAALAAALADQAHKYWMLDVFGIGARQPITLTPFLDVVLSWNYGVSYSLFQAHEGVGRALLLAGQSVIVAGLIWWLWRAQSRLLTLAIGLVVGGALGNAADRLARGAVADFFYFHTTLPVGPLANYVFNVADVAITAGVAMLLFETLFSESPPAEGAA